MPELQLSWITQIASRLPEIIMLVRKFNGD